MVPNQVADFLKVLSLITFAVFVLIFFILSWALNYHWRRYGFDPAGIAQIRLFYFSVSLILLAVMALSLVYIMI